MQSIKDTMFEYLNTKYQRYNVTHKQMTHQKKKIWRLKKTLVRETKKNKKKICNKVYNFFSSNLCLMFDLSNMGIYNHRVNFHGKILSLKKKSSS